MNFKKFSNVVLFVTSQSTYSEKRTTTGNSSSANIYKELILNNIKHIILLFVFSLLLQISSLYMPLMIQNMIDSNIELLTNYSTKIIISVIGMVFVFYYLCQVARGLIISKMQYVLLNIYKNNMLVS